MKPVRTRTIVLFFLIAHAAYLAMGFTLPSIADGPAVPLFDLRMFSGYDDAYAALFLAGLTATGRAVYLYAQFPLDTVYPVAGALFFSLLFLRRTGSRPLATAGLFPMAFDLLENALVFTMIASGSAAPAVVSLASFATVAKGFAYVACYGAAAFLSASALVAWLRRRSRTRQ